MLLIKMFLIPMAFACCESNEWKGITPLESTRAHVEKILGKPIPDRSGKHAAVYQTEREKVWVLYSFGTCRVESKLKAYNGRVIPEMTVVQLRVTPNVRPKLAELISDERKFERVDDGERAYFNNDKVGVRLAVNRADMSVEHIDYDIDATVETLWCGEPNQ